MSCLVLSFCLVSELSAGAISGILILAIVLGGEGGVGLGVIGLGV